MISKNTNTAFCILASLILIFVLGCSTHQSSLKTESGRGKIYLIDEAELFNSIYKIATDVFPKNPVFDIDGPIRGFYISRSVGLDSYETMIRIFAATGYTETGNVEGYYFEVTGQGTLFSGPMKDRQIYDQITNLLQQYSVLVTDTQRGEYKLERDRWKLKQDGESLDTDSEDVAERLMKLEKLYKSGLITKDEYESKREEILSDL